LHGRPAEVPSEPGARGAAAYDLIAEERVEVVHRVDLGRGGVGPGEAENAEPALHLAQHILRLLAHGVGPLLAAPYRALTITRAALARLAAAGDDEALGRLCRLHGVREGVERRLGRRRNLGTHIAARHRIDRAVEQAPFAEGDHIDLVEGAKAILGERR